MGTDSSVAPARVTGRQLLLLFRVMILKVLVLVAVCVASSQALNCLSCSGNCMATPGGTYDSVACDQRVKYCTLEMSGGKPTLMGCAAKTVTSYPADYTNEVDANKRCTETTTGTADAGRPSSGLKCLCDTNDCNGNHMADPSTGGAQQQVSGSIILAGALGLVMARI